MATAAESKPNDAHKAEVDSNRILSVTFAQVFRAYKEASDEVQEVIGDMCDLINDPDIDPDDHEAAVATLVEALFPTSHNGKLGIDIEDLREVGIKESPQFVEEIKKFDADEVTFSDRLKTILEQRNMKQDELAELIGVQQPAVSMMLARKCRPQRKTLERIAEAFKMPIEELWPSD